MSVMQAGVSTADKVRCLRDDLDHCPTVATDTVGLLEMPNSASEGRGTVDTKPVHIAHVNGNTDNVGWSCHPKTPAQERATWEIKGWKYLRTGEGQREPCVGGMRGQERTHARGDATERWKRKKSIDCANTTMRMDQFGGGFGTDAFDSWNVVAFITHQRQHVWNLHWRATIKASTDFRDACELIGNIRGISSVSTAGWQRRAHPFRSDHRWK